MIVGPPVSDPAHQNTNGAHKENHTGDCAPELRDEAPNRITENQEGPKKEKVCVFFAHGVNLLFAERYSSAARGSAQAVFFE